jgi:hypothetical protein
MTGVVMDGEAGKADLQRWLQMGRDALLWEEDGTEPEANADMWARPDESRDDIIDRYRYVWAHADATIEALDLDTDWWAAHHDRIEQAARAAGGISD